ncbi:DNA topoisomerase III, partial [mine drainage metagenome]
MALDANGVPLTSVGRVPLAQGWRAVFANADPDADPDDDANTDVLPPLADGASATVHAVSVSRATTQAPKRYTEGALVMDMAAIGKFATDPKVKARLRETSGIGTEATRAAVVANLRDRGYLEPQGKFIVSTERGRAHVDALHPSLRDPVMT